MFALDDDLCVARAFAFPIQVALDELPRQVSDGEDGLGQRVGRAAAPDPEIRSGAHVLAVLNDDDVALGSADRNP